MLEVKNHIQLAEALMTLIGADRPAHFEPLQDSDIRALANAASVLCLHARMAVNNIFKQQAKEY